MHEGIYLNRVDSREISLPERLILTVVCLGFDIRLSIIS